MEGLILLLAEFLALPLLIGLGVLLSFAATAIELLVELIAAVVGLSVRRRRADEAAPSVKQPRISWRTAGRWIGAAGGVMLVLMLIAVAIANTLFFEAIVRAQLARVDEETGISVTFDSADGNLWTGVLVLHEVKFERANHKLSRFDLSARTFTIDMSTVQLLFRNAVFERVELQRLRGTFDRVGLPNQLKPRRSFRLDRFQIDDALVQMNDHTRGSEVVQAELQVESLVAEPLRSDWAVFDLLFRSNAAGQIAGSDFSISMQEIPEGRQTRWEGDGLPVELMAAYLSGPLHWITAGKLDVEVTDRWQVGNTAEIEMHWDILFRDITAEVPADAGRMTKAVAQPAVAFLNKHSLRLPLKFDLVMDRNRFQFAGSPDAVEMSRKVGDALTNELGRLAGVNPQNIKEAAQETLDRFKDFLDKRRKGQ